MYKALGIVFAWLCVYRVLLLADFPEEFDALPLSWGLFLVFHPTKAYSIKFVNPMLHVWELYSLREDCYRLTSELLAGHRIVWFVAQISTPIHSNMTIC